MSPRTDASTMIPKRPTVRRLHEAAQDCRACPLWRRGTQTVFGDGKAKAPLMLVGEQPGDGEDREGEPFVGTAGRELSEALEEAGISPDDAYVTNVVKHFKWRAERGKRRIHQKPNAEEIAACRPWLEAELKVVKPRVIVCLGATAAKSILGSKFRVTTDRGRFVPSDYAPLGTGTVHPSSILRIDDDTERRQARRQFRRDLGKVAAKLAELDGDSG